MKKVSYKRKPGDFEIRILADGHVVMLAPDQELIELAQILDPALRQSINKNERIENARKQSEHA